MSTCCWKNDTNRLAHGSTDLQCIKMQYLQSAIEWSDIIINWGMPTSICTELTWEWLRLARAQFSGFLLYVQPWASGQGRGICNKKWKVSFIPLSLGVEGIKKSFPITLKNWTVSQVWWLVPVIQHFGRPQWVDHLRSGVQDQPGQHGETLSLLKIQKLARCGGRCL